MLLIMDHPSIRSGMHSRKHLFLVTITHLIAFYFQLYKNLIDKKVKIEWYKKSYYYKN